MNKNALSYRDSLMKLQCILDRIGIFIDCKQDFY